jgi:carbonic anhydrase
VSDLAELFERNREWATAVVAADPEFFTALADRQAPEYLWIGCSDSRVPANQIVGLQPGDVFVHRNVANVVVHTDLNCLSVLQYAVDVLRVRHVIVCGHYGCGGVAAVLNGARHGLIDNWLRHVADVAEKVVNVCQTTIVEDAWNRGQALTVHGLVYGLQDGLLRDLDVSASSGAAT